MPLSETVHRADSAALGTAPGLVEAGLVVFRLRVGWCRWSQTRWGRRPSFCCRRRRWGARGRSRRCPALLPAAGTSTKRRLDLAGVATLSVSLLLIVVPLIVGRGHGWPAWNWLCLAASAPALGAFVATQRRADRHTGTPLINLQLLTRPAIAWGLVGLLTSTGT